MKEYHKIQTVFKRDPETNYKTLLFDEFSTPEFHYLRHNSWVFTEKVDGTNIRVVYDRAFRDIEFKGKTDRASLSGPLVKRLQERFLPQKQEIEENFPEGVCFYGEGYGAKIQKGGGNYRKDQDFVLFDVKVGDWWLQRKDVEAIAELFLLDVVPIIGAGTLYDMLDKVEEGFDSVWGNFTAEGIVARPATELKTRSGQRVITKLKYKDIKR